MAPELARARHVEQFRRMMWVAFVAASVLRALLTIH
jgi:hypothetical protein